MRSTISFYRSQTRKRKKLRMMSLLMETINRGREYNYLSSRVSSFCKEVWPMGQ
jgi:hypothetical protein